MFQPGEEGYAGALLTLDEGLLSTVPTPVARALGLHVHTRFETGTVNLRSGGVLASNDTVRITVHGRGGHASSPHLALDPIVVAAEIVHALQVMTTRRIDVFTPVVITIGAITAGTARRAT